MTSSQRQMELLATLLADPTYSQAPPPLGLGSLLLDSVAPTQSLVLESRVALAALAAAVANRPSSPVRPFEKIPQPPNERERFLLFTKVLFKYLERLNDPSLKMRAKTTIAKCTMRNRMGISEYVPLTTVLEHRLKQSLGEVHYVRAQTCYNNYLRKTATRSLNPTPAGQAL